MKLKAIRTALFEARESLPLQTCVDAYHEADTVESGVRELIAALDFTTWSSGCWCTGKDKRGHSATCEGRRAAIRAMGGTPPGEDFTEPAPVKSP